MHTEGFVTKVEQPVKLINPDTLVKCRTGLTRRIRNAATASEKARIRVIRDEIDFLINAL